MFFLRTTLVLQLLGMSMLWSSSTRAADCCDSCGCAQELTRVCRPIYTTRRQETTVFDSLREDYCLPRHVKPVLRCRDCREAATACSACQQWCDEPKTRNRLIQKKLVEQVPTILWVTEYRCDDCAGGLPTEPPSAEHPSTEPPFIGPQAPAPPPEAEPFSVWKWLWHRESKITF
jgi:hypothetical protein